MKPFGSAISKPYHLDPNDFHGKIPWKQRGGRTGTEGAQDMERRRILLDGSVTTMLVDGDELVAGDGRRVA